MFRMLQVRTWAAMVALSGLTAAAGLAPQLDAAPQTAAVTPVASVPDRIDFNRDVRPILSDKCYACHGPGTQLATLRFDLEDQAKKALRGDRYAIVPGDPDHSLLIARITATDPNVRMPQKREALSAREIEILRRWITQGATWQKHWAYIPPVRPATPSLKDARGVRNPIDAFVRARLEREGLTPSPEADKATLIRRVSLDLTGLPPTPAEIDAFLADRTPERLRARWSIACWPRRGTASGWHSTWLDAARYADTQRLPERRRAAACGAGATG